MWASVYPEFPPLQMGQIGQIPMRFQGSIPPANGIPPLTYIGLQNAPIMHKFQENPTTCNLFNEQLKSTLNKSSAKKPPFPLKRAAYHVTIAYKIYLDKL